MTRRTVCRGSIKERKNKKKHGKSVITMLLDAPFFLSFVAVPFHAILNNIRWHDGNPHTTWPPLSSSLIRFSFFIIANSRSKHIAYQATGVCNQNNTKRKHVLFIHLMFYCNFSKSYGRRTREQPLTKTKYKLPM